VVERFSSPAEVSADIVRRAAETERPHSLLEVLAFAEVDSVLGLFMNERELPFIPFGKEHRFAQDAARLMGFSELSATLQLRLRQWKYTLPPAGALVPDVTSALPFVERVLRDVEEGVTDVSLFRQRWAIKQMQDWQAQGVDYPDALGAPNFLN
jgi:hypothetical protein